MKKLDFGKTKSMAENAAMATKRGYDTGKKTTGAKAPTDWKVKPKVSAKGGGTVGLTIKKKM